MFGPFLEIFAWLKTLTPRFGRRYKPNLSFITLHYIYIISLTICGSIVMYGSKNIDYIDALFFASGAATQSGLNTINVNELHLYQQITLYFLASVANPIIINTFVVFVRLYWFEKRFQNVVMEAQRLRRTVSRSRPISMAKNDADPALEEKAVGDRRILVMHPGPRRADAASQKVKNEVQDQIHSTVNHLQHASQANSSSGGDAEGSSSGPPSPAFHYEREIMFADETRSANGHDMEIEHMAAQRGPDQHIAFLENQRNPKDKSVLYIPGPRDWDRGDAPHRLSEASESDNAAQHNDELVPTRTRFASRQRRRSLSNGPSGARATARRQSVGESDKPNTKLKRWLSRSGKAPADGDAGSEANNLRRRPSRLQTFASFASGRDDIDLMPYLSYQPTVGRNSAFVNLTEAQREELGGIEYRALKTLAVVLVGYFFGFHIFGIVCLVPWYVRSGTWGKLAATDGYNKVWWGIFTSASMFNDLGFTLNPDSMLSFQRAIFPLLLGSYLIIIGNTGFPCMLRFVIWIISKMVPKRSAVWEEICFLLDHPRRCFTLLFPSKATWWLFWILVLLNGTDLFFFVVLDLKDPTVTSLPPGIRILDGWFQAASTRTAGFADVNLAELHPAIQVSYMVMMYISVFPIAISVRRTNVYEERSLGIYAGDTDDDDGNQQSYVGAHLRRQLSFDLWYVFMGLFIIAIVEGDRLQDTGQYAFTLFAVLFEVVSAYGTVGLSLGYPGIDASFSAEFRVISKLIIIAMQIRGRHRGLPYALDKAILLPSEGLQKKEEDDALRRRRNSTFSTTGDMFPGVGARNTDMTTDDENEPSGIRRRLRGGWSQLLSSVFSAGPPPKESAD